MTSILQWYSNKIRSPRVIGDNPAMHNWLQLCTMYAAFPGPAEYDNHIASHRKFGCQHHPLKDHET